MKFLTRLLGEETYKNFKENWDNLTNCLKDVDFTKESPMDDLYSWFGHFKDMSQTFSDELALLKEKLSFIKSDRTIEIPYDRDNEILTVEVRDNLFTVKVTDDGENPILHNAQAKTVTIPTDSCPDGIKQKYDKDRRVMIFTFNPCHTQETDDLVNQDSQVEPLSNAQLQDTTATATSSVEDLTDMVENILQDRREGMSFRAIGRKYNISDKRAARIIRKNGLE